MVSGKGWRMLKNVRGRKLAEKAAIKWLSKEVQNFMKKLESKAAKVEETKV